MSLTAPSLAVCSLLDGQTITPPTPGITLSLGRNLFRGYVRAPTPDGLTVPMIAVFALCTGGARPVHYKNADETRDRLFADVTLYIRYAQNFFEDGEDFARSIWKLVQRNIPTDYRECHSMQSEPVYQGLDDAERPLWTINLETIRTE